MNTITAMPNPLLAPSVAAALPPFDAIRPEHVGPAVDVLLAEVDAALETAVSDKVAPEYDAISSVFDVAGEKLRYAWGAIGHLNAVADGPALREAYNAALPKVTELQSRHASDERLYAKYKALLATPAAARLSAPRRKALANAMRDFVLAGAELSGAAKERFQVLQARQAELAQGFSEHVLDATDAYAHHATREELDGVPDDVIEAARVAPEAAVAAGASPDAVYKLTLHFPSYFPVMQYGRNRALRERLYRAHVTRASEFGPAERDNSAAMRELLALRQEEAQLLGYPSYAHVSLVPKMAESPDQVIAFLRDLAARARPSAERDIAELRAYAAAELGLHDLQAWDMAYASERLKEARYAFSDQEVKQYFTEPTVLAGLFGIIETLFEVTIRPDTAPVWHESVRFFRIERAGRLVGQFYLDPYARPGKRPGAWMDDVRGRWRKPTEMAIATIAATAISASSASASASVSAGFAPIDDHVADAAVQTPVAHLVCNFAPPAAGRPALLTHDDVTTLFHEFGHGLHHMLTQVEDIGVAGISGVEWDAVELPSQFMENFCWEWDVVRRMTSHVDTGAPLPRALFDKMLAAKNFQSGLQTLRQVEFSLLDMRLHAEPGCEADVQAVVDAVRREIAVTTPPAFNRFQHTFSHIFAGGYSAGYYSYKWAEVLSADAWSAFEESAVDGNPLDVATGRRYREAVLEAGGSRPALESFIAFRGRAPNIDALLRHQGMA